MIIKMLISIMNFRYNGFTIFFTAIPHDFPVLSDKKINPNGNRPNGFH